MTRNEGRPIKDLTKQAKLVARAMFGDGEMKRAISHNKLATIRRDYAGVAMNNN